MTVTEAGMKAFAKILNDEANAEPGFPQSGEDLINEVPLPDIVRLAHGDHLNDVVEID